MEFFTEYKYRGIKYYVSTFGRIFGPRGREIKQRKNSDGYMVVTLGSLEEGRTAIRVHSVVAYAFYGEPEDGHEVNHIDYNRTNNNISNLEYVSHIANVRWSSSAGHYSSKTGENNGRSTLTNGDVIAIRKLYADGERVSDIARAFNSKHSTIFNIVKNKTWKHLL